jgi:hypothetical protein
MTLNKLNFLLKYIYIFFCIYNHVVELYIKNVGESSVAVYEGEGPTSGSGQINFQGRSLTRP